MDRPEEFALQSAPDQEADHSTVRLSVTAERRQDFQVGDIVAVVARRNVRYSAVVAGQACSHHSVEIANPQVRPDRLTLRLSPRMPPHAWQQVRILSVASCAAFLTDHPDQASATVVSAGVTVPGRRHRTYRQLRNRQQPVQPPPRARRRLWPRLRRILTAPRTSIGPQRGGVTPDSTDLLWRSASAEHDRVHTSYLSYETDPELVLMYPAVADVTIAETAAFHPADARAQALRTENGPASVEHADSYHRAVTELARRWDVCEQHARRLGHRHLKATEVTELDKAVKLMRHARNAATDFERASYLDRAQTLVTRLLDDTSLRLTSTAQHELSNLAAAPVLEAKSRHR